jgi:hypothetical protein
MADGWMFPPKFCPSSFHNLQSSKENSRRPAQARTTFFRFCSHLLLAVASSLLRIIVGG